MVSLYQILRQSIIILKKNFRCIFRSFGDIVLQVGMPLIAAATLLPGSNFLIKCYIVLRLYYINIFYDTNSITIKYNWSSKITVN